MRRAEIVIVIFFLVMGQVHWNKAQSGGLNSLSTAYVYVYRIWFIFCKGTCGYNRLYNFKSPAMQLSTPLVSSSDLNKRSQASYIYVARFNYYKDCTHYGIVYVYTSIVSIYLMADMYRAYIVEVATY